MRLQTCHTPGRGQAVGGATEVDRQAATNFRNSPSLHEIQARHLRRDYGLTPAVANLVAELAFGRRAA
jgi:hypothetical protein